MADIDRKDRALPTRRDLLVLGVGLFVVSGTSVLSRRRESVVRRTVPVMGTIAEIAVVHPDAQRAQAAIDEALEALERVEGLMTRFTATSDVGRANRHAAAEAVPVSEATATVLRLALAWAEASDGAFDPSLGRSIRLWDVGHRTVPPGDEQVRRLAGRRLYRAIDVDRWKGRPALRFTDPDVEIDLGGIAKGHGVDRAVEALRRHGVRRAVVNVGGDLYALGRSEAGAPWQIGIQSPDDPRRVVETLSLEDAAVATSGDYLQYFEHRGRRYHHLLDPDTAAPRTTPMHSVSVVAGACITADAAATAVFGQAPDRARRLLVAHAPDARVASAIGGA